jgi:hypothetical protein
MYGVNKESCRAHPNWMPAAMEATAIILRIDLGFPCVLASTLRDCLVMPILLLVEGFSMEERD